MRSASSKQAAASTGRASRWTLHRPNGTPHARRWRFRLLAQLDLSSLAYLTGIVILGVTALTVGIAKGLQFIGVLPKGKDFGAGQGSEAAAIAWRGEAEAREAQVKRQDEEISRLTALVTQLSGRLDAQQEEIVSLKARRDELLARPDYSSLLERFTITEEIVSSTLTLLKAHDELTITRLEELPRITAVDQKLDKVVEAVVPSAEPLD